MKKTVTLNPTGYYSKSDHFSHRGRILRDCLMDAFIAIRKADGTWHHARID